MGQTPGDLSQADSEIVFGRGFRSHPTPAGVVRLSDARIMDVNESWLRALGYERHEVIGNTHHDLGVVDAATRKELGATIRAAGSFSVANVTVFTKERKPRHVAASAQMQTLGGETYVTFILADHTELTEAQAALRRAHDELKAAEAARLRLLSSVAHDLANPLSPIRIQLHIIEHASPSVGDEFVKPLRVIARNVQQLSLLVQDLREFAKLQSQSFQLRKEPADMSRIVREVVESVEVVFQDRDIRLRSEVARSTPVSADPMRVSQVLFNLLGNAAKFTPRGGVVELYAGTQGGGATVSVRDSGPGMDQEQIARLFQPFSQVHDVRTSDVGMGIGLFVCKQIVDLHGGRIWAESPGPGRGSTFSFTIPAG